MFNKKEEVRPVTTLTQQPTVSKQEDRQLIKSVHLKEASQFGTSIVDHYLHDDMRIDGGPIKLKFSHDDRFIELIIVKTGSVQLFPMSMIKTIYLQSR